jgi:uncharacterized repeat protein (TIGR01451 family)
MTEYRNLRQPGLISQWGGTGAGAGQLSHPYGSASDTVGNLYVADGTNNRIQIYTTTGVYTGQLGGPGTGDGEFNFPAGVAYINGYLYTSEIWGNRIQKFGPCGTGTSTPTFTATPTASFTYTPAGTRTVTLTGTIAVSFTFTPAVSWTQTVTFTPAITATATQVLGSTLLYINKTVGGEAPAVGAVIRYEIEIRNTGTKPAYNLAVWDTLPVQVEFLNNLSGIPYVKNGQYIRWDLSAESEASPLNPGDILFVEFDCRIVSLSGSVPVANYAGCDYFDGAGKHAPIFSQLVFYPLDIPAVYPNPATDYVKFTNIVPGSQVEIFTLSGEFVNSMPAKYVVITWNMKNMFDSSVSPGVYYYLVRDAKGKVSYKGKIFIVKENY